jgi:hypothetical protein
MKSLFLIFGFLVAIGSSLKAQTGTGCDLSSPADSVKYAQVWNFPIEVLKDAARDSYFKVMDIMNDSLPFRKETFDTALNRYDYWRKVVDLKLTDKKDRDEFHNWIVAEARAAGKLKYDPAKKS